MSQLTKFEKNMSRRLRHLLDDETPYEHSVDGDTIADYTCDFIVACEEFEIEDEAEEFVDKNPTATIDELWEFFDSVVPPPEIVDSEEID